jgi:hypothetical protein
MSSRLFEARKGFCLSVIRGCEVLYCGVSGAANEPAALETRSADNEIKQYEIMED